MIKQTWQEVKFLNLVGGYAHVLCTIFAMFLQIWNYFQINEIKIINYMEHNSTIFPPSFLKVL